MKYLLIGTLGDYGKYERTFNCLIDLTLEQIILKKQGWACEVRRLIREN